MMDRFSTLSGILLIVKLFRTKNLILGFLLLQTMQPGISVSLLDGGGIRTTSLITNPRSFTEAYTARTVGDVITVKVIENLTALKKSEIFLNNDTRHGADLTLQIAMTTTSTLTPDTNDVANMITNFSLPVDYGKRNLREVSVNNSAEYTALVSCLVVEVDPESGNMVIEGSRQILMEGQTKSLYVRGVINPKDIDANNEIPSYKLANAQLQVISSGTLATERDSGFLQKIFRKIF